MAKHSNCKQWNENTLIKKLIILINDRLTMSSKDPTVIPMLAYENGIKAMEWLAQAFGFVESTKMVSEDGVLVHGEMIAGDGLIMLASPIPDYQSPKQLYHEELQFPDRIILL